MAKYTLDQIKGVLPAMLTFFDENENVDEKRTRDMVEFLLTKGIGGLYLTGSTGEGFVMDAEEREKVVEIVIDQVAGRCPVIVHVGDIGTKKSIRLAQHAYKAGADAISSVPPFYWKFSENDIYNYYKDLSESTPLPMVIYNVPLAGLMGTNLILRLAQLENVKGMKFTGKDHDQMLYLKAALGKDFIIYSGCDEMAMSGLSVGTDGIIGSFYNVMPETFVGIYNAVKSGDLKKAQRLQIIATEIILAVLKYDCIPLLRNLARWQGVDAGYCRRPFHNFAEEELVELKKTLNGIREKYQVTYEEVNFYRGI